MTVQIAPSILSADFAALGAEISAVDAAGADLIHVDVMDGHYVPNLTIGAGVVKAIRPHTKKTLDVHLMITPVDSLVPAFAEAGADIITFHPEATHHPHRTAALIRSLGKKVGVSLNPATPLSVLDYLWDSVDLILLMTVNPGFGGQHFIEGMLPKIAATRQAITQRGLNIDLEVDGGINARTAGDVVAAGANILVAGSAVFTGKPQDYASNISALRG